MEEGEADQDRAEVRAHLMRWDAIGVADAPGCQDEYDCLLAPLLVLLRNGAGAVSLQEWIALGRRDHFGLTPDQTADRALAEALVSWWESRTR